MARSSGNYTFNFPDNWQAVFGSGYPFRHSHQQHTGAKRHSFQCLILCVYIHMCVCTCLCVWVSLLPRLVSYSLLPSACWHLPAVPHGAPCRLMPAHSRLGFCLSNEEHLELICHLCFVGGGECWLKYLLVACDCGLCSCEL